MPPRIDRVDTFARLLAHPVEGDPDEGGFADEVCIVARASDEYVGPNAAVERVVARSAGDRVAEVVAGECLVGGSRVGKVLDIDQTGETVGGQRRAYLVDAAVRCLDDNVAVAIDNVDVVVYAARHGVVARPAVERVVSEAAGDDDIVEAVADQRLASLSRAGEVLHIDERGEAVARERRAHRVDALVRRLDDRVARTADHVDVIP